MTRQGRGPGGGPRAGGPGGGGPRAAGPDAAGPTLEPGDVPGYEAHLVPAFRADKAYVCPTCTASVPAGTGHVVAWPEGLLDERRHWHRHCWRLAVRRGRVTGSR